MDCPSLCATLIFLVLSFFSVIPATHTYLDIQRVVLELGDVRNHVALGHARALQEGRESVRITLRPKTAAIIESAQRGSDSAGCLHKMHTALSKMFEHFVVLQEDTTRHNNPVNCVRKEVHNRMQAYTAKNKI